MLFQSFPESPGFESLLSGASDIDLLTVLGEVGGCDLAAVDSWIGQVTNTVMASTKGPFDFHVVLKLATQTAGLQIDKLLHDGRVSSATESGTGWPLAVAILEQRLLAEFGIGAELVVVIDEVFLRADGPGGLLFHPAGAYSVWVDECVAVGFLVQKFGVDGRDLRSALANSCLRTSDRKSFVSSYLESVCGASLLVGQRAVFAYRQLAALDPHNSDRWLDVARAELDSGCVAAAFNLAARLERRGHSRSSEIRRRAEVALSKLN